MAQIRQIDDLTGDAADETIEFGLDGKNYEIDLATANASKLRETLARYVAAARRAAGGGRSPASSGRGRATADRQQNQTVRAWARQHGMTVSDRGRIPAAILDAYHGQR